MVVLVLLNSSVFRIEVRLLVASALVPATPAGFDIDCHPEAFLLFSAKYLVANDEEKLDAAID